MIDQILDTILKNTFSLTSLKHRLRILKSYLEANLFGSKETEAPIKEDSDWLKTLPPPFYQNFNKDNVYQIFSQLEHKISQYAVLIIYLTFVADEAVLSQIGQKARKTFANPALLLDVKYDPKLIAGTALSWKGMYKDYSLHSRIEEKRGDILESFKKFLT